MRKRMQIWKQRWSDFKEIVILLKEVPIALGIALYLLLVSTLAANAEVIWGLIH